jgi:hypothetical protein
MVAHRSLAATGSGPWSLAGGSMPVGAIYGTASGVHAQLRAQGSFTLGRGFIVTYRQVYEALQRNKRGLF